MLYPAFFFSQMLSEELSEPSLSPMEVSKDELLSTVKVLILSRIGIAEVKGECVLYLILVLRHLKNYYHMAWV